MNIQQAAEACGLAADTIRFYEREGVLPAPPRQENGYRAYTANHIATLLLAKGLRRLEVPLSKVAPILSVAHNGTCGDVRGQLLVTLKDALAEVEAQLRDLTRTRDHVASMLDGLARMSPNETTVPGMAPCECVQMVSLPS